MSMLPLPRSTISSNAEELGDACRWIDRQLACILRSGRGHLFHWFEERQYEADRVDAAIHQCLETRIRQRIEMICHAVIGLRRLLFEQPTGQATSIPWILASDTVARSESEAERSIAVEEHVDLGF